MAGWLVGWVVGWLGGWVGWEAWLGWLTGWLAGWLAWLAGWGTGIGNSVSANYKNKNIAKQNPNPYLKPARTKRTRRRNIVGKGGGGGKHILRFARCKQPLQSNHINLSQAQKKKSLHTRHPTIGLELFHKSSSCVHNLHYSCTNGESMGNTHTHTNKSKIRALVSKPGFWDFQIFQMFEVRVCFCFAKYVRTWCWGDIGE